MGEHERCALTLSTREQQVLLLAVEGGTDKMIATRLDIGVGTVNTYWSRIRAKLGPSNRTELAAHFVRQKADEVIAQLRIDNEHLQNQFSESICDENEIGRTVEILRTISEAVMDAVLVVDKDGVVRAQNASATILLGYSGDELMGLRLSAIVPTWMHGQHHQHRAEFLSNPEKRTMGRPGVTTAVKKDGTEVGVKVTLSPCAAVQGRLVVCVLSWSSGNL